VTLRKFRHISLLLCVALLASPLAGCGRKTPLDTPTVGEAKEKKRLGDEYPAASEAKPPQGPTPFQKQPSFILDPLLEAK